LNFAWESSPVQATKRSNVAYTIQIIEFSVIFFFLYYGELGDFVGNVKITIVFIIERF